MLRRAASLGAYRREWNEQRKTWGEHPLHDGRRTGQTLSEHFVLWSRRRHCWDLRLCRLAAMAKAGFYEGKALGENDIIRGGMHQVWGLITLRHNVPGWR